MDRTNFLFFFVIMLLIFSLYKQLERSSEAKVHS